jgi:DNA polymerase
VLRECLTRCHKFGFYLIGHAHDEGMALVRKGDNRLTLAAMIELFKEPIEWAPGMPLGAAGWVGQFYRK